MLRRRRTEIAATLAATAVGVAPLLLGFDVKTTRGLLLYLAVALLTIGDEDILTILLAPPVAFPPLLIAVAAGYGMFHRDGAICS